MKLIIFFVVILFTAPVLFAQSDDNVGFIWHYPFVANDYTENISLSGANVMNARVPWGLYEKEEGVFDFSDLDRQLEVAKKDNFKLVLILEFNPFCRPAWLYEKCKEKGELTLDAFGNLSPGSFPIYKSKLYYNAQEKFIKALVSHINKVDKANIILGYQAGIEWWFPLENRYNPIEIDAFRNYLKNKYKNIAALNKVWQSNYSSFDVADAPNVAMYNLFASGREGLANFYENVTDPRNAAWFTPEPIKIDFKEINFTVDVENTEVGGLGSFLQIAWFGDEGYIPISVESSDNFMMRNGKRELLINARVPSGAKRFGIYMLLVGRGSTVFLNPRVVCDNKALVVPYNSWSFDPRTKQEDIKGISENNIFKIFTKVSDTPLKCDFDIALYDWQTFWRIESAEYINSSAKLVKKYDKKRYLMSFLSFNFAFLAEWDYNAWTGVFPDEFFLRAKDIDVLGMQLTGAEGDPYRIAAGMDLARKYNKPMCNLDLLDFAGGVFVPLDDVIKMSHVSIAHGAKQLFYCNWAGPAELSYQPYYDIKDISRMVSLSKLALDNIEGYKPAPKTALIHPYTNAGISDINGYKNSNGSFIGWYKILEKMQINCDVITLREIESGRFDLKDYSNIIVPDCEYISDKALQSLKSCSDSVNLIIAGKFADYNELGLPRNAKIINNAVFIEDYGNKYAGTLIRYKRAGDTPPMILLNLDSDIQREALVSAEGALKSFKNEDFVKSDFDIKAVTLFDKNGKKAIYIINMSDKETEVSLNLSKYKNVKIISDKGDGIDSLKFRYFCIIKLD